MGEKYYIISCHVLWREICHYVSKSRNIYNVQFLKQGFDGTKYKNYTIECTKWLNWNYDELCGDPGLMMDFIDGNWDSDRFLVVEPGKKIVASNDDNIICTD